MILSEEAKAKIEGIIESADYSHEGGKEFEDEVMDGEFLIMFTFMVYAHYVKQYNYHSEVPYNCYEDVSYYEYDSAEITEIKAYNEDEEEVEITNKKELSYW